MNRPPSRRVVSVGLVLFVASIASCAGHPNHDPSTRPHVGSVGETNSWPITLPSDLLGDGATSTAIVIANQRGESLFESDADRLLLPASNMKLLTVGALLHYGEGEAVLRTTLLGNDDGSGPVWLVGDGDPLLDPLDLATMSTQLRERGIVSIDGPIVATAARDPGPHFGFGWAWDDEPASYMPYLSGLTLAGGSVTVTVTVERGATRVRVTPDSLRFPITNTSTAVPAGTESRLTITRSGTREHPRIDVSGTIADGSDESRRLSVPEPARFAAITLKDQLVADRLAPPSVAVTVDDRMPPPGLVELAVIERPMADVLRQVLRESDNLAAELILRRLGRERASRRADHDATNGGIERINEYIEYLGHDPSRYRIADGSGLSRMNLISPRLLVDLLVDLDRQFGETFRSLLPVAGEEGTLRDRMVGTSAAGNARAKTGTLTGVVALSGYVEPKEDATDGGRRIYAILTQHFTGPSKPWRDRQDAIVSLLASGDF